MKHPPPSLPRVRHLPLVGHKRDASLPLVRGRPLTVCVVHLVAGVDRSREEMAAVRARHFRLLCAELGHTAVAGALIGWRTIWSIPPCSLTHLSSGIPPPGFDDGAVTYFEVGGPPVHPNPTFWRGSRPPPPSRPSKPAPPYPYRCCGFTCFVSQIFF